MSSFDHPWFKPLWRRVVVVALCFIWAGVELFAIHSWVWGAIFVAAGLYTGYHLLYRYTPPGPPQPRCGQIRPGPAVRIVTAGQVALRRPGFRKLPGGPSDPMRRTCVGACANPGEDRT